MVLTKTTQFANYRNKGYKIQKCTIQAYVSEKNPVNQRGTFKAFTRLQEQALTEETIATLTEEEDLLLLKCLTSGEAKVPRLRWHELSRGNKEGLVRRVGRESINLDQDT